jgi:hypothetical protein
MIRDNLTQLEAIARLAGEKGARVVNFLTFNPYFEWARDIEIDFQARHSEIAPYLARAIDTCTELGVEANVRYLPPCQLPGREAHVFTGFQLPYDTHEYRPRKHSSCATTLTPVHRLAPWLASPRPSPETLRWMSSTSPPASRPARLARTEEGC